MNRNSNSSSSSGSGTDLLHMMGLVRRVESPSGLMDPCTSLRYELPNRDTHGSTQYIKRVQLLSGSTRT